MCNTRRFTESASATRRGASLFPRPSPPLDPRHQQQNNRRRRDLRRVGVNERECERADEQQNIEFHLRLRSTNTVILSISSGNNVGATTPAMNGM